MQKNIHRNRNIKHAGKPYLVLLCLLALIGINGCAQMIGMAIQEPVKQGAEWSSEGNYSFYVPDNYERDMDWPLVVLCHGEFPDSPKSHIHYWTNRAEAKGFIVAAPKLRSPHSFNTGNPESEIKKLREDERQILAVVKRLRGGYSISEDRVFIHGWSNGTIAALHTGLKHPDVFRGVSVVQPRFEGRFLADAANIIDYLQPVFVDYGSIDSF
ncbi:MAG: prolyl oligopeptidase family serine peptidase, partial [Phycisphaerae bacterium]